MDNKKNKEEMNEIKNNIINKVIKNPRKMEDEIKKELQKIDSKDLKFLLKEKSLLKKTKQIHVIENSLLFLKEISTALDQKENMYEKIINNNKLVPSYSESYFKNLLKRLPEINKDINSIRDLFKKDKMAYDLNNMEDEIIRTALNFVLLDNSKCFSKIIKSNRKLNVFPYNDIMDKIIEIDSNLYNSVKAKDIKKSYIIKDYLKNDYSSFEYFLKSSGIGKNGFEKLIEEVKKYDVLMYQKFVKKYQEQKHKYNEKAQDVLAICHNIINGIEKNNGEKRDYSFLDYCLATKLTVDEFIIILNNAITINHQDLVKVKNFFGSILPFSSTQRLSPEIISDNEIKRNYYGVGGRMITDDEKGMIIKYMDSHNFIHYKKLYEQIVKLYLTDQIDITPKQNKKKVLKEQK